MSYYLHETPGRLRIKIPELKRNPDRCRKVQYLTEDLVGVDSVSANVVTGSLVVNFDPNVTRSEEILRLLINEGHLSAKRAFQRSTHLSDSVTTAGTAVSRVLVGLVVGKALEGSPLSFLSVLI